jgi:6-phosphogluconolactonase
MLKRAAALLLVCAGIASWVGCATTSSHYVYAAIPAANAIAAFREDPNSGVLTALPVSPISAGLAVQALALHPSGKFLYAANAGEGDVSLFTIASTGLLSEVSPRTQVGLAPTLLAMDTAGAYLYVGNVGSATISVFSINSTSGALTAVDTITIGVAPLNMKLAPSGSVLYVTASTGGNPFPGVIEVISVNAGMPVGNFQLVSTGANPSGLAIDPTGSYLYVGDGAPDNSFWEYTISGTTLTPIQGSPVTESYVNPISLLVDKTSTYLYGANEGSGNVALFQIGSGGGLNLLTASGSPFGTIANPSVLASDPNGKFLFVGNQVNSGAKLQSFIVDTSNGALTAVAEYPVGNTPTSIAVTP